MERPGCTAVQGDLTQMGVTQNAGYLLGGSHTNKGFILGSPYLGKLPKSIESCSLGLKSLSACWKLGRQPLLAKRRLCQNFTLSLHEAKLESESAIV